MVSEYVDIKASQLGPCTSYIGGAAWFKATDRQGWYVFAGTPTEIKRYFEMHPGIDIRVSFVTAELA